MDSILLYVSSGLFITAAFYIGLIIWDRNRIWTLLSNDSSFKTVKLDRRPRTIFDGSND